MRTRRIHQLPCSLHVRSDATLTTVAQNASNCSMNLLHELKDFLLNFGLSPSVTPENYHLEATVRPSEAAALI